MGSVIHCIARCTVCDWHEEDYKTAKKLAAQHSKKTGHYVIGEQAVDFEYGLPDSANASTDK